MVKTNKMSIWDYIAVVLLIIGGLNWGLFGFFDLNLISLLFGDSIVAKILYGSVFASAVYSMYVFYLLSTK